MSCIIKVGDTVVDMHPFSSGFKKEAKVVEIRDHEPVDGPIRIGCVVFMDNGRWSFIWNLKKVDK